MPAIAALVGPFYLDGQWGAPLNQANLPASYKSIADYLGHLKERYDTEADLFSFNESDLGLNIRHTAQEHAALLKRRHPAGHANGAAGASKNLRCYATDQAHNYHKIKSLSATEGQAHFTLATSSYLTLGSGPD